MYYREFNKDVIP